MNQDAFFNKVFYDLVKELKQFSPVLKTCIKATYKIKSTGSENLDFFKLNVGLKYDITSVLSPFDVADICTTELLETISLDCIKTNVDACKLDIVSNYVYILCIIMRANDSITFNQTVSILSDIQQKNTYNKDDVLDEDLVLLFDKLISPEATQETAPLPAFLANTMIGTLAQELTSEIDIASLGINSPADLLSNSGGLGTVLQKITNKLQDKVANGSLDAGALMKEALSLVNSDGNGMPPMFGEMLKNMMGGAAQAPSAHDKSTARLKLQQKYERTKKN